MSIDDDLEPTFRGHADGFEQMNVGGLSIEELREYIAHAQAEIARAEEEIRNRDALRNNADALFKN
jgi:uncharacterized small protein (DUF1192 family)